MVKSSGPKKPLSGYAFFVKTCREEHRKKHPNETVEFQEFSKKCAEKWKTMNEKEKKRFDEMNAKDKLRYEREMKNYVPPPGEKKPGGKKRKDPDAPKRPLSSFFMFCGEERAKVKSVHPDWTIGEVGKELGKRWEQVKDRTKFEKMADKDKARYQKEMAVYSKKGSPQKKAKPAAAAPPSDSDESSDEESS